MAARCSSLTVPSAIAEPNGWPDRGLRLSVFTLQPLADALSLSNTAWTSPICPQGLFHLANRRFVIGGSVSWVGREAIITSLYLSFESIKSYKR